MALSGEQRTALWRAKCRALARDGLGRVDGNDVEAPWGAGLDHDGALTLLIEVDPAAAFGQALALANRRGAHSVDLLVATEHAGLVAARSALFDPAPTVHGVEGTALVPVAPTVPPTLAPPEVELPVAELLAMPEVMTVIEHGVVTGECRGLEVARVTGYGADQRLSVGVGAYDQGAFEVMHPDLALNEALAEVVSQVLTHRRRGARPHPINRLVRERWLRAELVEDPARIGAERVTVVEGVEPRAGLHAQAPAFAVADAVDGRRSLVACSVGIDLGLVPAAASVANREACDRIEFVLPARDHHRATTGLASMLRLPCAFTTADEPWPTTG